MDRDIPGFMVLGGMRMQVEDALKSTQVTSLLHSFLSASRFLSASCLTSPSDGLLSGVESINGPSPPPSCFVQDVYHIDRNVKIETGGRFVGYWCDSSDQVLGRIEELLWNIEH